MKTIAFLISIGVHIGLAATLVLASGPSNSVSPASPIPTGEFVWISLAEGIEPSGPPSPPDVGSGAKARKPVGVRKRSLPESRTRRASRKEATSLRRTPEHPVKTRPAAQPIVESATSTPTSERLASDSRSIQLSAATPQSQTETSLERIASEVDAPRGPFDESSGPPTAAANSTMPRWPDAGRVDHPARPRRPIRPRYPVAARQLGEESIVVVEAWVDDGGTVARSLILESGGAAFDDSALQAVSRASFRPARHAGRTVASRVALRIHFALRE